jgi:outer membrane immunogenic protein
MRRTLAEFSESLTRQFGAALVADAQHAVGNARTPCERRTHKKTQHAINASEFASHGELLMKKVFMLAILALAGSTPMIAAATAAPLNRAAPEIAVTNWTGFYVGGDFGGAFQHTQGTSNFFQNDALANNSQDHSRSISSGVGGIHAGFNWQVAPMWVIGIEGDWQWTHSQDSFCRQTDTSSAPCNDINRGFATIGDNIRSFGTVRGRLGWAFDQVLIYGTGGVAIGDVKTSLSLNCPNGCGASGTAITTTADTSPNRAGWVAGGGIERIFGKNWIARVEYLHVNLGNESNTLFLPPGNCAAGGPCGLSWSRDLSYDIVRGGISYKFGGL